MAELGWLSHPDDPADYIASLVSRVCQLILSEEVPDYEVVLAQRAARLECLRLLPEKIDLFDLVYGARFARLKAQFRDIDEPGNS